MGMGSFQGLGLWSRLGDLVKSWPGDVHSCVEARFCLSVAGAGSNEWPGWSFHGPGSQLTYGFAGYTFSWRYGVYDFFLFTLTNEFTAWNIWPFASYSDLCFIHVVSSSLLKDSTRRWVFLRQSIRGHDTLVSPGWAREPCPSEDTLAWKGIVFLFDPTFPCATLKSLS